MGQPTVLFFGSVEHPTLSLLYHHLQDRGHRRVVYLPMEQFPHQPRFELSVGPGWEDGLIRPEEGEPVAFDDLVSVVLDRYFVNPPDIEVYSPDDQEYIRTESWATLIALFAALSKRCLVANHVLLREHLANRFAELCYLGSAGLPVPRTLVSSVPADVARFVEENGGAVYRPVNGNHLPFRQWGEQDAARLEELKFCPMHFEEPAGGAEAAVAIVGDEFYTEAEVPPKILAGCVKACRGLDLHLAEAGLRETPRGWVVTGLSGFLSPDWLHHEECAEMVSTLLERGLAQ